KQQTIAIPPPGPERPPALSAAGAKSGSQPVPEEAAAAKGSADAAGGPNSPACPAPSHQVQLSSALCARQAIPAILSGRCCWPTTWLKEAHIDYLRFVRGAYSRNSSAGRAHHS